MTFEAAMADRCSAHLAPAARITSVSAQISSARPSRVISTPLVRFPSNRIRVAMASVITLRFGQTHRWMQIGRRRAAAHAVALGAPIRDVASNVSNAQIAAIPIACLIGQPDPKAPFAPRAQSKKKPSARQAATGA